MIWITYLIVLHLLAIAGIFFLVVLIVPLAVIVQHNRDERAAWLAKNQKHARPGWLSRWLAFPGEH